MKKLLALLMLVLPVMGMENEHSKTKAKYTAESRRTFLKPINNPSIIYNLKKILYFFSIQRKN